MFFSLSKIFGAIFSPLNLVFLLLVAGALIAVFSKKTGRSVKVLGMALFILFGLVPLGPHMLSALENYYDRPATMPEKVDGILVLGGSFETAISAERGVTALNDTAERVTTALALAHQYPQAIIVFSGGNGHLMGGQRTEAQDAAAFLSSIGFDDTNVIYEDQSRNTYENIKFSEDLVLPQEGETWLLVTSAYHIPRALAVARKQGWPGIVPYPVDYRTTGKSPWLPDQFDMLGYMAELQLALHEYLGIAAYQATGKISLPL